MKKTIRLTESDLNRIVKRVIKEQPEGDDNDEIVRIEEKIVLVKNASSDTVKSVLRILPKRLKFLAIVDSEFADFSNIDVCEFPNLVSINLKGTENNLEEQEINCDFEKVNNNVYDFFNN